MIILGVECTAGPVSCAVLDNGKIVEDGSYDELLSRGGLFAELVSRQRVDV